LKVANIEQSKLKAEGDPDDRKSPADVVPEAPPADQANEGTAGLQPIDQSTKNSSDPLRGSDDRARHEAEKNSADYS
jgi:hypothetical protein